MMARLLALGVAGLLVGLGVAAADRMLARFPTEDLGLAMGLAALGGACLLAQRAAWAALPPRADLPADTPPHDWWDPRLPCRAAWATWAWVAAG